MLLIALGPGLLLTIMFLWLSAKNSAISSTQTQIAGDALMHSQRIGKAAPNAIQANPEALKQMGRQPQAIQPGSEYPDEGRPLQGP